VHETIVDCGLTLQFDRVLDGHFLFNPHGPDGLAYGGEQLRGTDTFTNQANDHAMVVTFSFASRDLRETDNGDGTLTILGQAAGNFVASGSHGPLVLRSTGIQRAEVLIDHAGTPPTRPTTSFSSSSSPSASSRNRPGGMTSVTSATTSS
jgi:hypothetical protein